MTRRTGRPGRHGQQVDGQLALPLVPALTRANRSDLARLLEADWQDRAACAGTTDPDAFYREDADTNRGVLSLVDPTRLCAGCPVARSCLISALLRDEQGVWGCTTETERDDITTQLVAGGNATELLNTTGRTVGTVGTVAVVQPVPLGVAS